MWTIIAIGSFDLMLQVLNGVAMLTAADGPAGYGGLVALGLLIGVLIAVARGIVTQRLDLHYVLVGWILYAVMFIPKVTVTVEDIQTGAVNNVANVPIGVAAIGSVTSTVGLTLADAFSTVFSYPGFTGTGYLDALDTLLAMRDVGYGDANDGTNASNVDGVDLRKTVREYLQSCTLYDIAMELPTQEVTWEKLRNSEDLLSDIQVNSTSWFTTVYFNDADPDGEVVTCQDGHAMIVAFVNGNFYPAWNEYVGSLLGVADAEAAIQTSLDELFTNAHNAKNYMLNALLKKEIELADLGYQAEAGNTAGVVMRTQAMEQRRVQWATEQSMFQEMARPLLAYIEAFFYAVSPFMAFLFTLGGVGITLFTRYLMVAIWIQLWMPIMAINNLYVHMSASGTLDSIDGLGVSPLSMTGLESVWTETASWVSVGGMMAAATPLLAFFLISGSYFAFTRLTDRMHGGDFINEKIAAPDLVHPAPAYQDGALLSAAARQSWDPMHGSRVTAAERVLPSIDLSAGGARVAESASQAQVQALAQWAHGGTQGLDLRHTDDFNRFVDNFTASSYSSDRTQVDNYMQQLQRAFVNDDALFKEMSERDHATLTGSFGLALQNPRGVTKGDITQRLESIQTLSEGQRESIAERMLEAAQQEEGVRLNLAEKIESNLKEGSVSRFSRALGVSEQEQFSEVQQDVVSTTESYRDVVSWRNVGGVNSSVAATAFGEQVRQEGHGALETLRGIAREAGINWSDVQDQTGLYVANFGLDPVAAEGAALGVAIQTSGDARAMSGLSEFMHERFGSPVLEMGDAHENRGVGAAAPDPGATREAVEPRVPTPVPGAADAVKGYVESNLDGINPQNPEVALHHREHAQARGAVREFFEGYREDNQEKMDAAVEKIEQLMAEEKGEALSRTHADRGFGEQWRDYSIMDNLTDIARSDATRIATMFGDARDAYNETGSLWEALSAGVAGWGKGGELAAQAHYQEHRALAEASGLPPELSHYFAAESFSGRHNPLNSEANAWRSQAHEQALDYLNAHHVPHPQAVLEELSIAATAANAGETGGTRMDMGLDNVADMVRAGRAQ